MLRSILLVDDAIRLVTFQSLLNNCRTLHRCKTEEELRPLIESADAVALHVPLEKLRNWESKVTGMRKLPILWLCSEESFPKEMEWGYALDGVLFASMTTTEMQYALRWGLRTFQQRKHWTEEREQLLQRLEERKWIDQAKAVLCEIKGISEAEAYDFLRKQAMNERKRIGDIAASIVKVYQLIHG